MHTFYEVLGFVAAICIGVVVLTLFFTAFNALKKRSRGFEVVKAKGFISDGRLVNVHLSNGTVYRGLRFVGFADANAARDGVPFQFANMVVCETTNGARVLFRPEAVRILEEVDDTPGGSVLVSRGSRTS
jgi:hypothetical protein